MFQMINTAISIKKTGQIYHEDDEIMKKRLLTPDVHCALDEENDSKSQF